MKTIILLFTLLSGLSYKSERMESSFDASGEHLGQIVLLGISKIDDCANKHYVLSLHRSIQSQSAWFNPDKTYDFELNDSTFMRFKKTFDVIAVEDQKIALKCYKRIDNWYLIKDKQGNEYWTSPVSYKYRCKTKHGEQDNMAFEKI